ncbi:hypothetical protein [Nocardia sp. NPDC006630]|uniref:hypothetical protein n=1 Tax=Nocardia sp. NPDC006630 TaxID=3157181 RepID=UPI0033A714F8
MEGEMNAKSRWLRRFRRAGPAQLDTGRGDLVVVASSFDDAEACSAVLGRAENWTADQPVVLRHHLRLPAERVNAVQIIAEQEGYETVSQADAETLILQRVRVLDAMHCAQDHARMVALAHRHDGVALGWDALQPPGEKK